MSIDAGHDTDGMAARITRQEGEAAAAFDQRCEIGFAIFSPEDQEITFPMSKAAAIRDFLRPRADRVGHGYMETARLAAITLPARTAGNWQMAPKLMVPSLSAVDILVDGFVAHRLPVTAMTSKITCNLFWRPGRQQAISNVGGEFRLASNLASAHATIAGHGLRSSREISSEQQFSSKCRLRSISR